MAGENAVVPEAPTTGAPEPGPSGPLRGRRAAWAAGVLATVLTVGGAWWVTAVHPGGHLSPPAGAGVCALRGTDPAHPDVAFGTVLTPTSDVELTGLTLVDARNVEAASAAVVPIVPDADGGSTVLGTMLWPLSSADRAGLTLDWDGRRDLEGARLTAGTAENLILQVHATDPAVDASWSAFRITYRTAGVRWVQTFDLTLLVPGGATCPGAG